MSRRYAAALAACLAVLLGVAWIASHQSPVGHSGGPPTTDAVRLGPQAGQPVAEYLAELPARLPVPGRPPVPALAQFGAELDGPGTAALLAGSRPPATPVMVVFRVSMPRVQTALRFERLDPVDEADPETGIRRRFALAQAAAYRSAAADGTRSAGRPARVAAAEAAALRQPDCRCVLAVLVSADRAGLDALAGRSEVRAVDAAPVGTPTAGVALAPLLPEQTQVVGPVPDDGPLPPP